MQKYFVLFALLVFPVIVFADCPAVNTIQHVCVGKNECNWQAPWYEGFSVNNTHDKTAVEFLRAEWARKDGVTKGTGTSLCYYAGNKGGLIVMGQNDWGNVDLPIDVNWYWTVDKNQQVKLCTEDCHFDYPK